MTENNTAFSGSVPENYERYLGPMLFEPYAIDLVQRLRMREGMSILELACGTGIVTEKLRDALPAETTLTATDLNEGMIAFAIRKRGEKGVKWQVADATALPFPDAAFDAVVCQFGLMFVPEKIDAMREAHRVLKPGGTFLFNVWDSLEHNDLTRVAHQRILSFFEQDPPRFFETPFGFYDQAEIRRLLTEVGFHDAKVTPVAMESVSPSAKDAASGLVQGTPIVVGLQQRDRAAIPKLTDAVAEVLAQEFGQSPCRGKMQALVCEATTR